MDAKPRLFNPVSGALVVGGLLVGMVAWWSWPANHLVDQALPSISNAPPAAAKNASTRFNRVRRPIAATSEAPEPGTSDLAKALAILLDSQGSQAARRQAAYDLVRIGTDESLDALQAALPSLPPLVQAAAAEALGQSKHPRATDLLLAMWKQADETMARSIASALGKQGCAECLAAMRAVLMDSSRPVTSRGDAAAGLGISSDADSLKLLKETFAAAKGTDLAPQILSAIGQRPFAQTREFFQQVMDTPGADPELRLAALESLNNLPAEATEFLTKYLFDSDADIRSEAAWALSTTETPGNAGPQILGLLVGEADAAVRLRLYQALSNQEGFDITGALHVTQAESDGPARLAAYQALAGIEESLTTSELRGFLNQTAVPALFDLALEGKDLSERLQAVMILQQVNSAASQHALQALRQTAKNADVQRALRGVN